MRRMPTQRERRRGAALIEGLIAVSTILLFFAATLFFHDLFLNKGRTLRAARYQAWTATRPGCDHVIDGHESREVELPSTLRVHGQRTLSVASATSMQCNAEPKEGDDMLSALSSIITLWHL